METIARRAPLVLAVLLALGLGANAVYRAGPSERTDMPVYLAASSKVLAGEDPLGAQSKRGWVYIYPPSLAVGLVPLTFLPQRVAAGVWYAIGVLAFVAGALGVRRALGRRGPFRWVDDGLPMLLVFFPTASALLRGQVGPLLLGILGVAAACLARRRDLSAGFLVALATAIKLTPGLVLVGLLAARRWRALGAGATGLLVWLVLVPALFLGAGGTVAALGHFGDQMVLRYVSDAGSELPGADYEIHIPNNQSLSSQITRRLDGAPRTALLVTLGLFVLVPTLVSCGLGRAPPTLTAFALLLGAPLLVVPLAWHHYHVLLFPALAILTKRRDWKPARVALWVFGSLSLLHFVDHPLGPLVDLSLRRYGLLGLGTLAVLAVLACDAWKAREEADERPQASS